MRLPAPAQDHIVTGATHVLESDQCPDHGSMGVTRDTRDEDDLMTAYYVSSEHDSLSSPDSNSLVSTGARKMMSGEYENCYKLKL